MTNMDVFNAQTEQPAMTLVGETAKYKTQADLEQGYVHLNEFAENLKREAAELREELGKRLSVEEQVRALATTRTEQPSATTATPVQTAPEPVKPFTDEDLVARIRDVNERDSAERRAQTNAQTVVDRLVETLGDQTKANDFVNAKARELGVSTAFLLDTAKTSPTGFFKLVDIQEAPRQVSAPHSEVNTHAFASNSNQVKPGTYAYYESMRKSDPKTYWFPKTQNQMHKEAKANPSFFN